MLRVMREWNRPLSLVIPESVGDELDRLARDSHRRPKDHAALLLVDAIRRASADGDTSLAALVEAFEAEGHHAFGEAAATSAGLVRRLLLQARGEAWLQAATRLRAALPSTATPFEPRTALPVDDRPTAA
jgi:hypothetical protein